MAFPGVRSAIQAMMGGGVTEQDAFNAEERRLIAARSAGALMDDRVSRASMSKRQDTAQGVLQGQLDMSTPEGAAVIARLAEQWGAAQRGISTRQKNTARGINLDALQDAMAGKDINYDVFNPAQLISGGTPMTGTGIDPVADQAQDLLKNTALTNAADARAEASRRTSSLGNKRLTTEEIFQIFGDGTNPEVGNYGDFQKWQSERKSANPDAQEADIDLSVGKYLLERQAALAQEAMVGGSGSTMNGTTRQTAIPSESLTEAPAPGTWIIVNGKPQKYLGQRIQ